MTNTGSMNGRLAHGQPGVGVPALAVLARPGPSVATLANATLSNATLSNSTLSNSTLAKRSPLR